MLGVDCFRVKQNTNKRFLLTDVFFRVFDLILLTLAVFMLSLKQLPDQQSDVWCIASSSGIFPQSHDQTYLIVNTYQTCNCVYVQNVQLCVRTKRASAFCKRGTKEDWDEDRRRLLRFPNSHATILSEPCKYFKLHSGLCVCFCIWDFVFVVEWAILPTPWLLGTMWAYPLTPWDPVGLPLDPLRPWRPTTWQGSTDQ